MLNFIGGIVVCKVGYDILKKTGVLEKGESKEDSPYMQVEIKYSEEEIAKVEENYKEKIKEAIKEGDTEKVFKLQSEMNKLLSQMEKENTNQTVEKGKEMIEKGTQTISRFANGFMKGMQEGIKQAKNGGDN